MAEYAKRDASDHYAKNTDGTLTGDEVQVGHGVNLQSGYLFKNNWEVSGRYTNVELDKNITGKNPENQYTLGVSKYIVITSYSIHYTKLYDPASGRADAHFYAQPIPQ